MKQKHAYMAISLFWYCFTIMSAAVIRVPQDRSTIQSAINDASGGDTILVSPGVYNENIDFLGKNITVASLFYTSGFKDYIEQTVIKADSMNANSTVTIAGGNSQPAVLCGFTITGGRGKNFGDNVYGGGIFIKHSSPIIRNNIITNNRMAGCGPNRGGGIALIDSASPIIIRNTIKQNITLGPCAWINYFGGGIWIDSTSNPIIGGNHSDANNIYGNSADLGRQVYHRGSGKIINAQYNYWGSVVPRDTFDVFTFKEVDISHYLQNPVTVKEVVQTYSPNEFQLFQNYPNPFNSSTIIRFNLSKASYVSLKVFDILGRESAALISGTYPAAQHKIRWDADHHGSGIYFYRLQVGGMSEAKRLLLLR